MPAATELRDATAALTSLAAADLAWLWSQVDSATGARDALIDTLPPLVDTYGTASAALAADWYDESRDEAGVRGNFIAEPAEVGDAGAEALVRWGVTPLFAAEPDWDAAQSLIAGGLSRRISNVGRDTITTSSIRDPQARGWQRRASSTGCAFCQMLAGRGAVYTRATTDFSAHDHCSCVAVPAWSGKPTPVKPYTPTLRDVTDTERASVREWIATNL